MFGELLMTSANGPFPRSGSAELPEETIRRFLLGSLSAAERPDFEQQLLLDDELAARVRKAEFELADDYAYERLTEPQQYLFRENFLAGANRDRKVAVSISLRDQFASAPASGRRPATAAYLQKLRAVFRFRQPSWRLAFAIAIFLLLVGTVWVAVKKERRIQEEHAEQIHRRSPNPSSSVEANHPGGITTTPEHQTASPAMPVHEQTPAADRGAVVVLSLSDGSVPSVNLPQGADDFLDLRITLEAGQVGPFRGELLTADGQKISGAESLKSHDIRNTQLDFRVPASLLKQGNYQFRLFRDNAGAEENLASYDFRIQ
jgi:hypothetical protein